MMLHFVITILMQLQKMNDPDKHSSSKDEPQNSLSFWRRIKDCICPCLTSNYRLTDASIIYRDNTNPVSKASQISNSHDNSTIKQQLEMIKDIPNRFSLASHRKTNQEFGQFQATKREAFLNKKDSRYNKSYRQTINIDIGYIDRMCSVEQNDCSVCSLPQNKLLQIGLNDRYLLVKVATANINVNLSLLKKEVSERLPKKRYRQQDSKYNNFEFSKFWNQRYLFFQKFDEGIKIDENSWAKLPPEQVCEYIANKCGDAEVILDGFAGVGAVSIKIAYINSCSKVIAVDYNQKKLKFLHNNAKIYQVDNRIELFQEDFVKIQKRDIDIIFVQPPLSKFQVIGRRNLSVTDFEPSLDKVIMRSLKLSSNLMMLLPPETNIDALCSCMNKCAGQLKVMRDSCSIKIEKIYCQMQIKYILVSLGRIVQTEIKLNDELEYIYNKLKRPTEKYFRHKKVIKKIREDQGMLELLNILKQSESRHQIHTSKNKQPFSELHLIDSFYELIQQRKIIAPQKLQKIISEQNIDGQKRESLRNSLGPLQDPSMMMMSPMIEQQKMQQIPDNFREAEATQSDYSHYTINERSDKKEDSFFLKRLNQVNNNEDIIINRTVYEGADTPERSLKSLSSLQIIHKAEKDRISHLQINANKT